MDLRTLAQPSSRFAGDHGEADPLTREALARVEDPTSYIRALVALCSSRLLLPIVASGDDGGTEPDPDRHAEMAAVTLTDESGSHLLAFTGVDSLRAWQVGARPVPCLLDELCATVGPAGAGALLIDVAGPHPLVISGEALEFLASGMAVVEFDDGEFGWVRYADDRAEEESSQG
ncbi:SseB family protein [Tessaracoccus lacteus]|uniref:SseB family protein n=1 Tax=Tessaracoccus lacteus TaxID=3041766 RepID=A0ABY8PUZ1_9ACTN|nr:SseB family protein [Tessaracoccus sp. T21]WGT46270.1 SseB family protein [Tessaracoccus sp. T21]